MTTLQNNTIKPNPGKNLEIKVEKETYLRLPIRTDIIQPNDDLNFILEKYLTPHLLPNDIVFISEKIVTICQGRIIHLHDIKPSPLARFLASKVDNRLHTKDFVGFGHGTARAMELLIQEAGYPRVIFAAAVSAVTRPLGIKGLFYFIVGKLAKSVDCPMSFNIHPYLKYAKRAPYKPNSVAKQVRDKFGCETVIVDANYIGQFSLGKSTRKITEKFIHEVFSDNPVGQGDELTPICIIRKKT